MITIHLSSANMGDVTEADFDAWAAYVERHVADDVTVEQLPFGEAGPDRISGGTEYERAALREMLSHSLWDAFCADASAWPQTGRG